MKEKKKPAKKTAQKKNKKTVAPKKQLQNKKAKEILSKVEKDLEKEFQKLFEQDEIKRRLAQYSSRRYRQKIKYQKAVLNNKTGQQVSALKNIQDIGKAENSFRAEKKIRKEDKERKRSERFFELLRKKKIDFHVAFAYFERKQLMEFIFNNVELDYFLLMRIKKDADKIASKIDSLLQLLDSTKLLVLVISKNKVTDYYIVNAGEYENE